MSPERGGEGGGGGGAPHPDGPRRGETTRHPYGSYRRRIRVVNTAPLEVVGGLEDDFHRFVVVVRHDSRRVTDLEARPERWPWTTCPDAGRQLDALVGMELSPRCLAVGDVTNPRLQCTHQFDLAGLAIAHATRALEVRQYDVEIPYGAQSGGRRDVRLWRDGELLLAWTLDGHHCAAPAPYSDAPWRGGFLRWADQSLPFDDAEAAIVLRRSCDIGLGRGADLESYPRASQLAIASTGICYTFQPETAAVSFRQIGTIRDWDGRVDEMLADGPRARSSTDPDAAPGADRSAAPGADRSADPSADPSARA